MPRPDVSVCKPCQHQPLTVVLVVVVVVAVVVLAGVVVVAAAVVAVTVAVVVVGVVVVVVGGGGGNVEGRRFRKGPLASAPSSRKSSASGQKSDRGCK